MTITFQKNQAGVGLVEVMVALLLLAVAILGFSAMQLNAVKATDESLMRNRAVAVSKELSENLRLYSNDTSTFTEAVNDLYGGSENVAEYCTKVDNGAADVEDCTEDACSVAEIAALAAWKSGDSACDRDLMLNIVACPDMTGINARQCIITSWGDTLPTMGTEGSHCTDADGAYHFGATCLIIEAY